jgi:hypothetical protein
MKRIKNIALLATLGLLAPSLSSGFDLTLRLSAGLGRLKADEVNRALAGWQEGWNRQVGLYPNWSLQGENTGSLHLEVDFEAELLFSFSRWLGLSLSTGYAFAALDEKQTLLSISQDGILYNYARPTKINALPVLISAYVFLPLGQKFNGYLRGGLGALYATYVVRETNKLAEASRFAYPVYDNAKTRGLSYVGGLGLTYKLDQSLGFFVEVAVRSARVSGFEGEDKQGVKGRLFSYEEYRPDIDFWQPQTRVHPEEPGGGNVRNVREATVDFSGYSAKIGVCLKL